MRSAYVYGRRRSQTPRLLLLAALAAVVVTVVLVWGGPEGDPAGPPLSRDVDQGTATDGTTVPGSGEAPDQPRTDGEAGAGGAPAAVPPATEEPSPDDLQRARSRIARLEAAGDRQGLRELLGALVVDTHFPRTARKKWMTRLGVLNRQLVYSSATCRGFRRVKVRHGDTYTALVQRLRRSAGISVSPGLLEKINRLPARRLRAGAQLKVPEAPVSILIHKSEHTLYLLVGKVPLLSYPVGLGRGDSTPVGTFTIGGKAKRPRWTDPKTGKVYEYGQPGHRVGSRWMRFFDGGRSTSYGIHGTNEPESIGRSESDGCIRMHDRNVEDLFELVPAGTKVVVRA